MQLQSLVLMLFMLIIIPIMIISANHNIFFILCTVVVLASSIRKIHTALFNVKQVSIYTDDEMEEDLEDMLNLDVRKFGTGLKVVKSLGLILFLLYCSFYTTMIWFKLTIALIIIYWLYQIQRNMSVDISSAVKHDSRILSYLELLVNLATVITLIMITFNKYIKMIV